MNFGEIIKRKRLEKGYTLDDMARMTGKKIPNISDLETRRGDDPRLSTMKVFGKALGIDFVIPSNELEPLRVKDSFREIELEGTAYSEEDQAFIRSPEAQPYIVLARLTFIYGPDSPAVKAYIDTLKTYSKTKT